MTTALHLLDTDSASYIIKHHSPAIEAKLAAIPPDRIFVSAVTRAELLYGLNWLPTSHRLYIAERIRAHAGAILSNSKDARAIGYARSAGGAYRSAGLCGTTFDKRNSSD